MDSNLGSPFGKQQTEYNLFRTNKKVENLKPGEGFPELRKADRIKNGLVFGAFGVVILVAAYFLLFV